MVCKFNDTDIIIVLGFGITLLKKMGQDWEFFRYLLVWSSSYFACKSLKINLKDEEISWWVLEVCK